MSQKKTEKSGKLNFSAEGNNSRRITGMSSVTKLKLDLNDVMTNSYTKFQVNISKDDIEKSGKLKCDGQTDGWTETASKLIVSPVSW